MAERPAIHLVAPDEPAPPAETVAQRVRRLQAEARLMARDHAEAFRLALAELHDMAAEIHSGGDAYPAGVRSVARDVLLACESSGQTLAAILGRKP